MRRTLVVLTALLALVATGTSSAQQGAGAAPPLKASLAACVSGPSEEQRFAVFTGSMPAYRGTKRMAMRFDLFTRTSASLRWQPVKTKGLGRWQKSDPNRAGFVYTKRVERLSQAAEYRVAVRFRWYQSDAKRPDRTRRTPVCRQPDQRPNLRIETLDVLPGPDAASRRYVATVLNDGRTAAGPFDVAIVAASDEVRRVAGLPPGERATVEVAGAACPEGERVTARADVRGVVEESSERDNRSLTACDGR
jgi:hypothetical protein